MATAEQWFALAVPVLTEQDEAEMDAYYDAEAEQAFNAHINHLLTDHAAHVQEGFEHAWEQSCGHLVNAYLVSQAIPF